MYYKAFLQPLSINTWDLVRMRPTAYIKWEGEDPAGGAREYP